MNFIRVPTLIKDIFSSTFGTGTASLLNYKIGLVGIESVTIMTADISSGQLILRLDGEVRNLVLTVESLVYSKIESCIVITDLTVSIAVEHTGTKKKWIEELLNYSIAKYMERNNGIVMESHVSKMNVILSNVSYAKEG